MIATARRVTLALSALLAAGLTALVVLIVLLQSSRCPTVDGLVFRSVYVRSTDRDEEWLRVSLRPWNDGDNYDPSVSLERPAAAVKVGDRFAIYRNRTDDKSREAFSTHAGASFVVLDDRGEPLRRYLPNRTGEEALVARAEGEYKWFRLKPRSALDYDLTQEVGDGYVARLKEFVIENAYESSYDEIGIREKAPDAPVSRTSFFTVQSLARAG